MEEEPPIPDAAPTDECVECGARLPYSREARDAHMDAHDREDEDQGDGDG